MGEMIFSTAGPHLHGVPSLDELAGRPDLPAELPAKVAAVLLDDCEAKIVRYQRVRDLLLIGLAAGPKDSGHGGKGHLLDSKQAAERLSVPVTWVREMARKGKLPSVRLGSYLRFRPEDIDALVVERSLTVAAEPRSGRIDDKPQAQRKTTRR